MMINYYNFNCEWKKVRAVCVSLEEKGRKEMLYNVCSGKNYTHQIKMREALIKNNNHNISNLTWAMILEWDKRYIWIFLYVNPKWIIRYGRIKLWFIDTVNLSCHSYYIQRALRVLYLNFAWKSLPRYNNFILALSSTFIVRVLLTRRKAEF